jgi:hypothetical protein
MQLCFADLEQQIINSPSRQGRWQNILPIETGAMAEHTKHRDRGDGRTY